MNLIERTFVVDFNERELNSMNQTKNLMTSELKRHPGAKRRKRLYIVNRARFVIMTLITLIIISTFISYISGMFMSEATTNHATVVVEIVNGDTLWDIASKYNFYEEDIREVIYRIKMKNNLESSALQVGQSLVIPMSNH
jgi:cell division protein YceG involved in septum cleavage